MDIVEKSIELVRWLDNKIDGLDIPMSERVRTSYACFDMVLEHQHAVTILIKHRLYGSAFTLARPVFDTYVRGVWIQHCATESQVKKYLRDKHDISMSALIEDIESLETHSTGALRSAKKSGWKLLNSFTHTGFNQIVRRNTDGCIEPNYDQEDVVKIVDFINCYALLSGVEIVRLAANEELALKFLEKIKSYVNAQ